MVLSPEDVEVWRVTTGRRQRLEPGCTPLLLMLPRDGAYFPADRTDPSPTPLSFPRLVPFLHLLPNRSCPVTPTTRTCKSVSDKAFPSRRN